MSIPCAFLLALAVMGVCCLAKPSPQLLPDIVNIDQLNTASNVNDGIQTTLVPTAIATEETSATSSQVTSTTPTGVTVATSELSVFDAATTQEAIGKEESAQSGLSFNNDERTSPKKVLPSSDDTAESTTIVASDTTDQNTEDVQTFPTEQPTKFLQPDSNDTLNETPTLVKAVVSEFNREESVGTTVEEADSDTTTSTTLIASVTTMAMAPPAVVITDAISELTETLLDSKTPTTSSSVSTEMANTSDNDDSGSDSTEN